MTPFSSTSLLGATSPRSLEPLVEAAQNGDREAFAALVEAHGKNLFGVAYRLTRRRQDAEEVVQESFLRAHRRLRSFRGRSSFRTWLHRIAVRCAYDLIRYERRRRHADLGIDPPLDPSPSVLESDLPTPERAATSAEIQRRLNAALLRLTPKERTAFVLRHVEGFSIEEIAHCIGSSRGAAKQAVFRATGKLRELLAPLAGGPQ